MQCHKIIIVLISNVCGVHIRLLSFQWNSFVGTVACYISIMLKRLVKISAITCADYHVYNISKITPNGYM